MKYIIIFSLCFLSIYDCFSQEKKEKNYFSSAFGVQFSGKGDMTGFNLNLGYKKNINKYFNTSINFENYNYRDINLSSRSKSSFNLQALLGSQLNLGKISSISLMVGPYLSRNNEHFLTGGDSIYRLGTKDGSIILIPPGSAYVYKYTSVGYALQLNYFIKAFKNARLGPVLQYENDNYSSSVLAFRLGFEVGL